MVVVPYKPYILWWQDWKIDIYTRRTTDKEILKWNPTFVRDGMFHVDIAEYSSVFAVEPGPRQGLQKHLSKKWVLHMLARPIVYGQQGRYLY